MHSILYLSAIILAIGFASAAIAPKQAHAQCVPAGTGGPDVINCSGTINANFNAGGGADTLNFLGGTVVQGGINVHGQGGSDTFNFLAGATVTNNGNIRGQGGTDTFNVLGTLNNIGLLNGNAATDVFNISGTLNNAGTFNGGGGDDTISITGRVNNSGNLVFGGGNDTMILSGLLSSAGGGNVNLSGGDDTLDLRAGSVLIGNFNFGGANDTLIVGNGQSITHTFNNGPEIINANGAPFVVSGNQVVVLDITALGQHDEMLSDLTSGIFNSVHARLDALGGGTSDGSSGMLPGVGAMMQLGGNSRMNLSSSDVSPSAAANTRSGLWAQAFGGIRNEDDPSGPTVGADHELIGGLAGIDGVLVPGVRIGAFAGGAHSEVDVAFDSQDLETGSFFGGGYVSLRQTGWFAHLIITAGRSDYDSTRRVANNQAAGGIQRASASYDGTFVSSEAALGVTISLGDFAIEPSMRGRYAHLSLDGYTETGAVDNLTVSDRDVPLWQGRIQVAFPFTSDKGRLAPRIGVEAWSSDDDTVSAILLGQSVSINPNGDNDEVTGFVGATASANLGSGISALVDGEVHIGVDGFSRTEARTGILVVF